MHWLSGSIQLEEEFRRYLLIKVIPKSLKALMSRRMLESDVDEDEYKVSTVLSL